MSKFVKKLISDKKLLIRCASAVVAFSFVFGGGVFAYNKVKEVKKERQLLLDEQKKLEEEAKIKKEAEERVAYFRDNNIAYLTFDDGPNPIYTPQILDILKKNDIKATFFMVGGMVEKNPEIVKRIKEEGHTLANHTTNHKYSYRTQEDFLADIQDTDDKISAAIGEEHKSRFVRVPGGSYGKTSLKEALDKNGYIDMNWTALNGDSEKGGRVSSEYVLGRIDKTIGDNQYEVVLMHDIKKVTAENLQNIIDKIKEDGYVFEAMTEETPFK